MYSIIYRVTVPVILFIVWLTINESVDLIYIITGVLVTIICLAVTDRLFGYSYKTAFFLPPVCFVGYLVFLLKEIYINGVKATAAIITGKIEVCFVKVKIKKEIKNRYLHDILATSITLTPGTITVDNKDGELTVLSMHKNNPAEAFEPKLIVLEKSSEKYLKS